jgi:hypothetical protein
VAGADINELAQMKALEAMTWPSASRPRAPER